MLENLDIVLAFTMVMLLLSLLATIIVQMVVSLLGLRGRNLYWAVQQLFVQAAPATAAKVEEKAGELAGKVLGHAVLSPHSRVRSHLDAGRKWKGRYGPEAIRLKELKLILGQLRERCDPEVQGLLQDEAGEGEATREWISEVAGKLKKDFPDKAGELDAVARDSTAVARGAGDVLAAFEKVLPDQAARVREVAQGVVSRVGGRVQKIDDWFETVMDSAEEKFKMWNRWITAGAAALIAFGFQVDSVDIVRQLTNQDVRAQVLSQVETVDAISRATLVDVGGDDEERLKQLETALADTREVLGKSGLEIFGPPIWKVRPWEDEIRGLLDADAAAQKKKDDPRDRLWHQRAGGSLVTALLLSLGAPFWYGNFRKLLNLRSVVAEKQEADAKAGKPSAGGAAGSAVV